MVRRYKATLKAITPIIINTGENFEFCEIVKPQWKPKAKDGTYPNIYFLINKERILDGLSAEDVDRFVMYAVGGFSEGKNIPDSIKQARYIVNDRMHDKESFLSKRVLRPVKFLGSAGEKFDQNPGPAINKIAMNPRNGVPYIPGSSVKGAIRTACLEALRKASKKDSINSKTKGNDLEKELLGNYKNVNEDPFKYLKVSDFIFRDGWKRPLYIAHLESNLIPIYTAMTDAECLHAYADESVVFEGSISIDDRLFACFSKDLKDKNSLLWAVDEFFTDNLGKDKTNLKLGTDKKEIMNCINKRVDASGNLNESLLRLGHYSGIMNYTFKVEYHHRNPKVSDMANIEGGNTLALIEGDGVKKYPAGFCLLKLEEEK